jgi:hypothetical protein
VGQHDGAFVGRFGAGPVQEFGTEALTAVGAVDGDPVGVQRRLGALFVGPQLGLAKRLMVMVAAGVSSSQTMKVSPDSMLRSIPSTMRSSGRAG